MLWIHKLKMITHQVILQILTYKSSAPKKLSKGKQLRTNNLAGRQMEVFSKYTIE